MKRSGTANLHLHYGYVPEWLAVRTLSRFKDPARFSFAHGGKDGHPFPVPLKVYDETINTLQNAVQKAKLNNTEKQTAIKKLHEIAKRAEENLFRKTVSMNLFKKERDESWKYVGKTVFEDAKPNVQVRECN